MRINQRHTCKTRKHETPERKQDRLTNKTISKSFYIAKILIRMERQTDRTGEWEDIFTNYSSVRQEFSLQYIYGTQQLNSEQIKIRQCT